jgi:flagellar biosynthesis/type III secretory pathway protein FliH
LKESEDIRQALDMCEEGAFTEAELFAYEKCWDVIYTERALLAASQAEGEAKGRAEGKAEGRAEGEAKGKAEGRAEGRAEGEAKGRAEGEAKGRAEGREEGLEEGKAESLTDVVLNCKRNGFSLEQIQMITGLGREKILEILRSGSEE